MAVNGELNQFADVESAVQQFGTLTKLIDNYVDEMNKASKLGLKSFADLQGSKNMADLTKNATAAADANSKVVVTLEGLKDTTAKTSAVMNVLNGHSKEWITNLNSMERAEKTAAQTKVVLAKAATENAKATTEQVRAGNELAKANLIEAKTTTENARAKEIEARYTKALTKEKERLEQARDKEILKLAKEQSAYYQLDKEHKEAANTARNLGAEYFRLEQQLEALEKQILNTKNAGLSITQLEGQRFGLVTQMENLGVRTKAANDEAMKLHTGLLSIDQAVGRSQRNVGNYNAALFSMVQIMREAPAFAISTATGILAIGNNIGPLEDAVRGLRATNKELVAAGGKAIPIWKTLGSAIFSTSGLLSLGTAALTMFAFSTARAGTAAEETGSKLEKMRNKLKNIEQQAISNVGKELAKVSELNAVLSSNTTSMSHRIDAMLEMNKLYPGYLENFTQEEILAGKATFSIDQLTKSIVNNAMVAGSKSKLEEISQQLIKATTELDEFNKTAPIAPVTTFSGGGGSNAGFDRAKKSLEDQVAFLKDKFSNVMQEITFQSQTFYDTWGKGFRPLTIENVEKDLALVNEQLKTSIGGSKEHVALLEKQTKLQEQLNELRGNKPKEKTVLDHTLQNAQTLTKELYDEYAKRLLVDAEYQKSIADDETKSMSERLTAFSRYSELTFQAQAEGLSAQYDQLDLSLKEIEKIEKKSADKRTSQEKELLGKKALLGQQYNNISAEYDLLRQKDIEKTAQGIVAIQENEAKKRLDALKSLTDNVDIQEAQAVQALDARLRDGTLKYRDYAAARKQVEDKFQKEKQQQIVDYLQEEITALSKQGVDVRQLQAALNDAQKKLYDADTQAFINSEKQKSDAQKELRQQANQLLSQAVSSAHDIYTSQLDKELSLLDKKGQKIQDNANAEIQAINDSLISEDKKKAKIAQINADVAEQENRIEQEKAAINRKKAIADRVAALANVAQGQASAQAAALTYLSNPVTAPLYPFIAGTIAAIGLVQAGAIIGQELPQYGDGVDDKPTDGFGIVGERNKPELVLIPGQKPQVVSTATTMYLPKHTRIVPQEKVNADLLGIMGGMTPGLIQQLRLQEQAVNMQFAADIGRMEQTYIAESKATRNAIQNKREVYFTWNNGQLQQSVKNGNNWTRAISKTNNTTNNI